MAGRAAGLRAGRPQGYADGYHLGRCQAVRSAVLPPSVSVRKMKVLFIPQGFPAIDGGIAAALKSIVSELVTGTPAGMLELARQHLPDLVLVMNGLHVFPADHLQQIKGIRKLGIRTAVWFADDPYFTNDTASIAPQYDAVFTHELSCLDFYRSLGCSCVEYLPLAVDTALFRPVPVEDKYRSDVCFIGMGFWNRIEVFDRLAPLLAGKRVFIGGGLWERMRHFALLKRSVRPGWIPIEESVKYYSGAKIVINLHRGTDAAGDNRNARALPARSINPRTYEISACGTLQLTDVREDLTAYYKPGKDLDIYHSPGELADKIEYYLQHDAQRRVLAYQGLQRTLQEHAFHYRINRLLRLLGY
ncbi:glycosyltransferase [Paenibacillus mucilaginosus]|nr:glycosyltransferase [Paenibacillus caseinilyticus]MCZ8519169.1 glycosyltransferase [Paenibacillus caseinilyticus]